jgi:hypothetical protein
VIDGMDGIEAGYHFAGVVGISPRKHTLSQLWRLANGAIKQRRREVLELASLVWSLGSIDWESYIHFGEMVETGSGGPVQLTPELSAKVEAEIERIRNENPGLPTVRAPQ